MTCGHPALIFQGVVTLPCVMAAAEEHDRVVRLLEADGETSSLFTATRRLAQILTKRDRLRDALRRARMDLAHEEASCEEARRTAGALMESLKLGGER